MDAEQLLLWKTLESFSARLMFLLHLKIQSKKICGWQLIFFTGYLIPPAACSFYQSFKISHFSFPKMLLIFFAFFENKRRKKRNFYSSSISNTWRKWRNSSIFKRKTRNCRELGKVSFLISKRGFWTFFLIRKKDGRLFFGKIRAEICGFSIFMFGGRIWTHNCQQSAKQWTAARSARNLLNPCGKSDQLIVHFNFAKMAERSEAKSAKRSFASKMKILIFWREASLRAFCFATLSHFKQN